MTRCPVNPTAILLRKNEDSTKRMSWTALPFAALVMLLPILALRLSAQALAPAPGVQLIDLTPQPGYFTEPSIAVNPRNPQQVVAAFQDNAHISYSFDAGRHWQAASGIAPPNYRVSGDVSVTYDNKGHAILCYIAFDRLGTTNYWAHNATRNGIFVRRSLDGGQTWEADHIPVAEQPTEPGIPFEDKPYIVADEGDDPYAGNLYVGWTRWTIEDSQMFFSRSTDGGKTWSKPIEIDHHRGLPRDDNGADEGFEGVVGPDGTLYAVWADGDHILLTISHDGGATFDAPRSIVDTAPIMFKVEDVDRSNGFPQIAIDPRGGGSGGRLVVAWSDYRNGGVDVFCSVSEDHGQTWSPAVRVNSDPLHDGADHFFQWMTVDPKSGAVYLVFYDRRGDPSNRQSILTLARSTDGARTFSNYAWTEQPFDARDAFIGDYTGIAAFNDRVYGTWTEERPGPANDKPWSHHSVVRVGIADFASAAPPKP